MERCKSLVKNFDRTLVNANARIYLCFIRLPQLRWSTNLRDPSDIAPQSFMLKVEKNGFLKAETTNLRSLFLHLNWSTLSGLCFRVLLWLPKIPNGFYIM